MTLAEVSVSMFVFGLLMVATLTVTTQVYRYLVRQDATAEALQTSRRAMDVIGKDLRGAAKNKTSTAYLAFSETTSTAVTFYAADATDGLVRVRVYRDTNGVLWRERTRPDGVPADGESYTFVNNIGRKTSRLGAAISATAANGAPLFQYKVNSTTYASLSADSDRAEVDAVIVSLTQTPTTSTGAKPVTVLSTVDPYNLK